MLDGLSKQHVLVKAKGYASEWCIEENHTSVVSDNTLKIYFIIDKIP